MRSLPLPLALTARLTPVAVLACAGWVLTSGPESAAPAAQDRAVDRTGTQPATAPSSTAAPKTYTEAPAPCGSLAEETITSLVPGARTAGREIDSTDSSVRRTCSWNALKGYDYRWLDVSFEISDSDDEARRQYEQRIEEKSGGGAVPGVGDAAYSVVNLTTEGDQRTREAVVVVRAANALVVVTYNGSDFESQDAPGSDEMNRGAIKAAKEAAAAL
ncbi:hypothetical protein [Streptomyces cinereospinus]|uniref:DUF3558 domain-containing protein n=1 Tax=Streptomyces cinereospinus TaxID=285561 RepID=A0ABV5N5L8_9ACTN